MGALPGRCGAVAEWSKALAWKVSIRQNRIEGSNPSRSANPVLSALGDDPELAALARSCVADDAELGLEPRQLAFLCLALFLRIAHLDCGFLFGLVAEVGDGDAVTEDLVPAQAQLRVGFVGQRIAYRSQP